MSELTMLEEDAAAVSPWFVDQPAPSVLLPGPGPAGSFVPPAARDTAQDAAGFGHYADLDCGEGALANRKDGTCEAIPGYATAMNQLGKVTALMDAEAAREAAIDAARGPADAAMAECMEEARLKARHECRSGRLPIMGRPGDMTEDECEALWRDGSGGGTDTDSRSRQSQTGVTTSGGYQTGLKVTASIPGLGGEGSQQWTGQSAGTTQDTSGEGRAATRNLRPFVGYDEKCKRKIEERFRSPTHP